MSAIFRLTTLLFLAILSLALESTCTADDRTSQPLSDVAQQIRSQVEKGNFAAARKLIETNNINENSDLGYLKNIVSEYEALEKRRQTARQEAFRRQSDKLDALRSKHLPHQIDDIGQVLEILVEAAEYADQKQKQALLQDPFVEEIILKAVDQASLLEAEGKWLDAYTKYYQLLCEICPDNQAYADHAQQLLDMADIAVSLRDSPCNTTDRRYFGVDYQIFIGAIQNLNANYVRRIVDYRQMTKNALKRCRSLVAVADLELARNPNGPNTISIFANSHGSSQPNLGELQTLSAILATILDELDRSSEPLAMEQFIEIYDSILKLNKTTAALPKQILTYHFAAGALSAFDPYTNIIWPSQVAEFEKNLNGEFTGIGITFLKEKGLWTISSLLSDTPAHHSGLDVGDVIAAVDRREAKDMNADCIIESITGIVGSDVTLTVHRPATDKTIDITVTRAAITVPSVSGWQRTERGKWQYMIDPRQKIGLVRLTSFCERTVPDFEEALDRLEDQGLKGLILDLRSNPGGTVDAAATIVDKFVEKGMIVSTRPRYGMATYLSAKKEDTHPDYPIVVLVNRNSASAAEIVAGALQDPKHKRAVLIGERTLGKGSVQIVTPLQGGAMLKYTMAYYHLPSGQKVQSPPSHKTENERTWGVKPDVRVELTSDEFKQAMDIQRANTTLASTERADDQAPVKRYSNQQTIDADPQLAVGLLVLKSKMLETTRTLALN